ncbi:hypothetical protein GL218_01729 [Daldinia childiae]|uniref:uncharacterized protein n=1 Tax=Daldinia childiae TaxID=326645 RepID=UPI001445279A|nr:uncharacterized protein GL218_01729 [Daldinia childiae]KAF3064233.1 hypothetical protein GL218_01729 [Daldinia childiae]
MNVESNSSYVATEALNIRFCGGRDPDRPTMARTPFWEMRPRCNFPKAITRQEVWAKPNTKKSDQDRDMYPFFYECLLLPLVSYTEEPVVNIHFDLEPGRRRTSYYRHPPVQNGLHRQRHYLGHRALFDFAHHCFELHSIGDDYFGYARSGDFERVMERLEFFTEDTESFLRNPKCQESDQLRAYLRRIRQAPVCNPFAGPQERNPFDINEEEQVTNELFVWRCYGEDDAMREKLIGWAMEEEDV